MSETPPAFLIAIDTEGDNVWGRPREIETRNAAFLPRFQTLCERYGFKPTYLTNLEMVESPVFRDFASDVLRRDKGEIGMHLHPWDSPPLVPLGAKDWYDQPYPLEYPDDLLDQKVIRMTEQLEETFQIKMTSHRAGRWGFNAAYCRSLSKLGYKVDCSVTPRVSWRQHPGHPGGPGGADFSDFPDRPYYLDTSDIKKSGGSQVLELPMTIVEGVRPWFKETARRMLGKYSPRIIWLRPDGKNLRDLLFIVDKAKREKRSYIQFTLHSSEFMPGGSPTFQTEKSIETLYRHMEILFEAASKNFVGRTLTQFAAQFANPVRQADGL
jgi:hypothetical protein